MTKPRTEPVLCRNCGERMVVRKRSRQGAHQSYHFCVECHKKGSHKNKLRPVTQADILGSLRAMELIFELGDRLARGDYANIAEADEMRRRIAAISKAVVV